MKTTKPVLKVLRGGAIGRDHQEVVLKMVLRLGSQVAMDYLSAIATRRRAMHDVRSGRRAAEHLVAVPLWQSRR